MLKPFGRHVLLKLIKQVEEEPVPGKLIMPKSSVDEQFTYLVLNIGEEVKYVKKDDVIHLDHGPRRKIMDNGEGYFIMDEMYIIAKVV